MIKHETENLNRFSIETIKPLQTSYSKIYDYVSAEKKAWLFSMCNAIVESLSQKINRLKNEYQAIILDIQELSPIEQDVILLHYINQISYLEIAYKYNYSERQIQRITTNALKKLNTKWFEK